ncbi:MAG TPA: nicotinate-nucleotide adenylyltransferase [Porticoccaceae bacterium]|nr:nicotinate-nucleotide adenylyltransferase [Porticoccaceae bacterium]HIG68315.1 nicotinate-nucleotide adenylyltransferase [Porticoccaceae bacterium]HIK79398.1 nicotinate-nucleotide adenylyltransferase [Porticoccaceae bacterium]
MGKSDNSMAVAIFGGTFDPIHNGHLTIASDLVQLLDVSEVRMVPCAYPPHRGEPNVSTEHRREMLATALSHTDSPLIIDDVELRRSAPSYSIDTVKLLRNEIGADAPLFMCIGMDALGKLDSWHQWQNILDFCHIAVSSRPGYEQPEVGPLTEWIACHRSGDLSEIQRKPNGCIYFCDLSMLDISSTNIRVKMGKGDDVRLMLPDSVISYIQKNRLYE